MTDEQKELVDFEEGHKILTKVLSEIEAAKKTATSSHHHLQCLS